VKSERNTRKGVGPTGQGEKMNDDIMVLDDVCTICDRDATCIALDDNLHTMICLHCLKELYDAWEFNDCEKLDYIGSPEYRQRLKEGE